VAPDHLALDRQLCFALYNASRAVTRAYGPLLDDVGLTYPQYVALLALWERADEPLSVGELGRRLRLETGTLTPLLKRLEAAGHIARVRDAADERRVLVTLTDQGRALRDRVAGVPAALVRASGLDLDEVVELRQRLVELVDRLDDLAG
jgi:DNA-binding MarR family transcriptional regulator